MMMEKTLKDVEREEKIARDIKFELEFLKEKILEVNEYTNKILFRAQQLAHSKCEYLFDEYPYIISQKTYDNGSYISFEDATDEIKCKSYKIFLRMERVNIQIGKIDLILILKVKEVEVKKRE
jgi:hypothetical protein